METISIYAGAIAAMVTYGLVTAYYWARRERRNANIAAANIAESYNTDMTWRERDKRQDDVNAARGAFYEETHRRTMPTKTVRVVS